jgi:hypothetical protein
MSPELLRHSAMLDALAAQQASTGAGAGKAAGGGKGDSKESGAGTGGSGGPDALAWMLQGECRLFAGAELVSRPSRSLRTLQAQTKQA